jgi:D-ribose pyranase
MKKTTLINAELSHTIASLGHTDMLVLADAGLPIPGSTRRIDLALTRGIPTFLDTLRVVLAEMHVERAVVAAEIEKASPHVLQAIREQLAGIPIDFVPHQDFKEMTRSAMAVVRTGEFTPYANVILISGVTGFAN